MPSRDLQMDDEDGRCIWRWDPNAYQARQVTLRLRHRDGSSELRDVPNTGRLELPDNEEVMEILSRRGEIGRAEEWREPR